jgi:hypothetical protein
MYTSDGLMIRLEMFAAPAVSDSVTELELHFNEMNGQVAPRDWLESATLAFPSALRVLGTNIADSDAVDFAVDVDGQRKAVARPVDRPALGAAKSHPCVHNRNHRPSGVSRAAVATPAALSSL